MGQVAPLGNFQGRCSQKGQTKIFFEGVPKNVNENRPRLLWRPFRLGAHQHRGPTLKVLPPPHSRILCARLHAVCALTPYATSSRYTNFGCIPLLHDLQDCAQDRGADHSVLPDLPFPEFPESFRSEMSVRLTVKLSPSSTSCWAGRFRRHSSSGVGSRGQLALVASARPVSRGSTL